MRLQNLQIPAEWDVSYNQFYDIEPTKESVENAHAFNEDLLQCKHAQQNWVMDLGWYPESDWNNGAYTLLLYEGDFFGDPVYELRTRDKAKVVSEINRITA